MKTEREAALEEAGQQAFQAAGADALADLLEPLAHLRGGHVLVLGRLAHRGLGLASGGLGEEELARRQQGELGDRPRWCAGVPGSKLRIDSTVSPKNSSRTGASCSAGNTSRMSPRSEKVPGSSTSGALR